ncbi:hypothetical protein AJY72_00185 [Campylobacter jejuni]|uniref:hypothetical protein n=1 Tax=Campylobacter jejuni TaxID=197 RepID=UPI00087531C6|nr:hypothetical protein [Campylobacter jejuni]OEV44267.1 hypothetical protein AJY59_07665 [Campylobacter jejuni]OEV44440.1 hypothetical protein AJY56_04385 [Campylobacter jejuni]OEV46383.1 hypothetical protein AJY61_09505 [Campylobacter jejuni]OEV65772.1 hypothetical protein AJY72_00185 [Campylobacter jejuni]OEW04768.1 hypothetical protein AJY55_02370 [Campylobacter jejuni]
MKELRIGVSIEKQDNTFLFEIMQSGIADSGLESTGDVYFESERKKALMMTDEEFDQFLDECDIGAKNFREW